MLCFLVVFLVTIERITEPKNRQKPSLRSFEIQKPFNPGVEWTLLTLRKHFTVISGLFTGTADPIKVFGGHFEGYWVELGPRNGPQRYPKNGLYLSSPIIYGKSHTTKMCGNRRPTQWNWSGVISGRTARVMGQKR